MNVFSAATDKVMSVFRGSKRTAARQADADDRAKTADAAEAQRTRFLEKQRVERSVKAKQVDDKAAGNVTT